MKSVSSNSNQIRAAFGSKQMFAVGRCQYSRGCVTGIRRSIAISGGSSAWLGCTRELHAFTAQCAMMQQMRSTGYASSAAPRGDQPSAGIISVASTSDSTIHDEHRASLECVPLQILHDQKGLLIVNKPYDVRMSGDFAVTLDKLVGRHAAASTPGSSFHYCHQLDYATSGVTVYTADAQLGSATHVLFQERYTRKEYVAVVEGHVATTPRLPGVVHLPVVATVTATACRPASSVEEALRAAPLEDYATGVKCTKRANRKGRIAGLIPARNARFWFELWRKAAPPVEMPAIRADSSEDVRSLTWDELKHVAKSQRGSESIRNTGWFVQAEKCKPFVSPENTLAPSVVDDILTRDTWAADMMDLFTLASARDARRYQLDKCMMEEAAVTHCAADAEESASDAVVTWSGGLPPLLDRPRFSIETKISEVPDDFRMVIDDRGRQSITLVQVLAYGRMDGVNVTKVLFRPITGRRHQLRLHAQFIGHPIMGDATYGSPHAIPRMMLHAWKLALHYGRLPEWNKSDSRLPPEDPGWSPRLSSLVPDTLAVCTVDPFIPGAEDMADLTLDEGAYLDWLREAV